MDAFLALLPNLIVVILALAVVVWQSLARVGDVKTRAESDFKRLDDCLEESEMLREKLHASELLNQKLVHALAAAAVTISGGQVTIAGDLVGGSKAEDSQK
jgi:hypothetical protein